MKIQMPHMSILLILLSLAGCATTYTPTQNVTTMLSTMSKAEAIETLQNLLEPHAQVVKVNGNDQRRKHGICTDGVKMKGHDLKVSEHGIAYQGYVTRLTPLDAKVERSPAVAPGKVMVTTTHTKHLESAAFDLRFNQIKWVRLAEPGMMTWVCALADNESEVKIQMTTSLMEWHAVRILKEDKDRFIAALLKLTSGIEIRQ